MSNYLDIGIYTYLTDGKNYTASFFAQKFEVSKKTIYRHINNLVYAGIPITTSTGKNGGIMLANNKLLSIQQFTPNEVKLIKNILDNCKNIKDKNLQLIQAKICNYLAILNIIE